MNLLGNSGKLEDLLHIFVLEMQKDGILPAETNDNKYVEELVARLKNQLEKMEQQGIELSDQSLKFITNDPMKKQLSVVNLLCLMITMEFLKNDFDKKKDFKLLFPEKLLEKLPEDQKELASKLLEALKKLKNATNKNEADSAYDEVMKLCDELSNKLSNESSLKPQLSMVRMMANQIKNEHHEDDIYYEVTNKKQSQEEAEDTFSLYLRSIYGGIDPTKPGSGAWYVSGNLVNELAYGAATSTGDENDRSLVAEQNRYDFTGGSKEDAILERMIGMGSRILEVLKEDNIIKPSPTNTLDPLK